MENEALPKPASRKVYERKLELYRTIREQIQHEDNLVNHRLTWVLLSQGFLFTLYYTLFNTILEDFKTFKILLFLLIAIAVSGIILSILGVLSIKGAFRAIQHLREFWYSEYKEEGISGTKNFNNKNSKKNPNKQFPDISYNGGKMSLFSSAKASVGIPYTIIFIWGVVIYFSWNPENLKEIEKKELEFSIEPSNLKAEKFINSYNEIDSLKQLTKELEIKVDSLGIKGK